MSIKKDTLLLNILDNTKYQLYETKFHFIAKNIFQALSNYSLKDIILSSKTYL